MEGNYRRKCNAGRGGKKFQVCDRVRGLDLVEESLRDVFKDVSNYIRNISLSLNRASP